MNQSSRTYQSLHANHWLLITFKILASQNIPPPSHCPSPIPIMPIHDPVPFKTAPKFHDGGNIPPPRTRPHGTPEEEQMPTMIQVATNLYVSALPTSPPPAHIRAIVSLLTPPLKSYPTLQNLPATTAHLPIPISDTPDALLLPSFSQTLPFIQSNLQRNHPTLIHCLHGMSRSIATCIAYLLFASTPLPQTPDPAFYVYDLINTLCRKFSLSEPSQNFVQQLIAFADMLANSGLPTITVLQFPPFPHEESLPAKYSEEVLRLACRVRPETFHKICMRRGRSSSGLMTDDVNCVRCAGCNDVLLPANAVVRFGNAGMFVLPVDWMTGFVHPARKGRLKCPTCDARIGFFDLADAYRQEGVAKFILKTRAVHTRRPTVVVEQMIRRPGERAVSA